MDPETIQAARAGRREAQAELLGELQDPWFRLALSLLGNAEEAREATQESAMRFLRDLRRFAGESHLRTWAIGIALNVVREMRRQRRPAGCIGLDASAPPGPDRQADVAEEHRNLHKVLAGLPERQREALVLRFFEQLTVEETAAAMNCAPGTVKATVHQALGALRRKLKVEHERSATSAR